MGTGQTPGREHDHAADCGDVQRLLCELLAPDTSPDRALQIREEIAACPECMQVLEAEREVRRLVRDCCGQVAAPDPLRERIVASLTQISYTEYTEYTEVRFR